MITRKIKDQIVIAINEYIVNSSDVYERIEKINSHNTHVEVSKILQKTLLVENLEDEVQEIWTAMKREAFN